MRGGESGGESRKTMQNKLKTSLRVTLFFVVASLAYVACSSQPSGTVITGGNATTSSPTGGPGSGSAGSDPSGGPAGPGAGGGAVTSGGGDNSATAGSPAGPGAGGPMGAG